MPRRSKADEEFVLDMSQCYRARRYRPARPSVIHARSKDMTRGERRINAAAREKAMVLAIERDFGLFVLDAKKRFEDHSMSALADSVSLFRDIMDEDRPKEDLKLLEQYRRFVVEQLAHGTDSTRLITYQKLDEEHARSIRPTTSESGLAILRDWLSTNTGLLSG